MYSDHQRSQVQSLVSPIKKILGSRCWGRSQPKSLRERLSNWHEANSMWLMELPRKAATPSQKQMLATCRRRTPSYALSVHFYAHWLASAGKKTLG